MLRNLNEIGSEFWTEQESLNLTSLRDGMYVLSGRTAIDIILQDMQKKQEVKRAYLPAYCCESMLYPFINRGIDVELYDVGFDGELHYYIDMDKETDIFYVSNYFGYENTINNDIIRCFKQKGAVIIYDKTHSLFMEDDPTDSWADYLFASIRKWLGVVGGAIAYKKDGNFAINLNDCPYIHIKLDAMRDKFQFLNGNDTICKQDFLNKFDEFGRRLVDDYKNYQMDDFSYAFWKGTDKTELKNVRQTNAILLHESVNLQFIGKLNKNVCPVFVPVFFKDSSMRDTVRKALIEAQVYCPIHWPKHILVTPEMKVNRLFETELSLICDQRYTTDHMNKIIGIINNIIHF